MDKHEIQDALRKHGPRRQGDEHSGDAHALRELAPVAGQAGELGGLKARLQSNGFAPECDSKDTCRARRVRIGFEKVLPPKRGSKRPDLAVLIQSHLPYPHSPLDTIKSAQREEPGRCRAPDGKNYKTGDSRPRTDAPL